MKQFTFPLQRILEIRRHQEEAERLRLQQLRVERLRLQDQAQQLFEQSRLARIECVSGPGIEARQLQAAYDYARAMDRDRTETLARAAELDQRAGQQLQSVLLARRNVRLLEIMRARRLAAHNRSVDREQESVASDLHLAKRERQRIHEAQKGSRGPGPAR